MFKIKNHGVTLLELAIVLALMGILAVSAIGYYVGTKETAQVLKAREDMNRIKSVIKFFVSNEFNENNRLPTSENELICVQFEYHNDSDELELSDKIYFMDSIPKTPWGLDYNIDPYCLVAWSTGTQQEKHKGQWGKRIKVAYTDIHTDNFNSGDISIDAWTIDDGSTDGARYQGSSSVFLESDHSFSSSDIIYMKLNNKILIKGRGIEAISDPDLDDESMLKDVEWGSVVIVNFKYYQNSTNNDRKTAGLSPSVHIRDEDYASEQKDMNGAIYLWPQNFPPQVLNSPVDSISGQPCGVLFSNRCWNILGINSVTPVEDGIGNWEDGEHEIKFITKYDVYNERYMIDVLIDGDFKTTIKLPSTTDDYFYLTISPDHFVDPAKATLGCKMELLSVSVSSVDFSKYYKDVLWEKSNTFGH